MKVLLTGATGFVGSRLLDRLILRGDTVRVIVRRESLTKNCEVTHFCRKGDIDVTTGSVTDPRVAMRAIRGQDVVYHLAATIPRAGVTQQEDFETNVKGTENLLRAAAVTGESRFVFTSSVSLYGARLLPATERCMCRPSGLYAISKFQAERSVFQQHQTEGLPCVVLRLSHVYGCGAESPQQYIGAILKNPSNFLLRGALGIVQWIHVDDVADALILAATVPCANGHVFNIAGDEAVSRRDLVFLVHAAAKKMGVGGAWSYVRSVNSLKYATEKAKLVLGFTPRVSLREGLSEMIADMQGEDVEFTYDSRRTEVDGAQCVD